MKRRSFLHGGLTAFALTPITPLNPSIGGGNAFSMPYSPLDSGNTDPTTGLRFNGLPLYIAAIGPQTGNDVLAQRQIQNGIRGAITEANARHGALDHQIDMHQFEDNNDAAFSRVAAQSTISDVGVIAVIGHLGGAATVAALPAYAAAQMPVIVPVSTADEITARGFRNVFRLPTRDGLEGALYARHMLADAKPAVKHVGVFYAKQGYGSATARAFINECNAQHIRVTEIVYSVDDEIDNRTKNIAALLADSPDILYFAGTPAVFADTVTSIRSQGYTGTVAASQGFFSSDTISRLGKAAEDMHVASSMPELGLNAAQSIRIQSFVEQFGELTPLSAFAYASAQIVIDALRRVNATTRSPIINAIANNGSYNTIVGDFRFNAFGDPSDPNLYFYTVTKGKWRGEGSFRPVRF